jgi:hypothetical protein
VSRISLRPAPARVLLAAGVAFTALAAGACGILDSDLNPDEVQVVIESPSAGDLRLVLSDELLLTGAGEGEGLSVTFLSADTMRVGLPHDRSYPLAPRYQFFVKVLPLDDAAGSRDLSMRVLIDGDERYNKSGTLGDDDFEFIYNFN